MTSSIEEVCQMVGIHEGHRWNADDNRWEAAKRIIGDTRVTLGPQASDQYLNAPEHLAMVLSRYRAAAALIGDADSVLEIGCGEGIGAGILAKNRELYVGIDSDAEATAAARNTVTATNANFQVSDVFSILRTCAQAYHTAAIALDVIEHIPPHRDADFIQAIRRYLATHGVCVIGTPNAAFEHLASPQSKVGHINLYTHDRLHALMSKHFHVVQSFGMQATEIGLGHPDARHYLLFCGIGPKAGV